LEINITFQEYIVLVGPFFSFCFLDCWVGGWPCGRGGGNNMLCNGCSGS